jgi:hypothetical protein
MTQDLQIGKTPGSAAPTPQNAPGARKTNPDKPMPHPPPAKRPKVAWRPPATTI